MTWRSDAVGSCTAIVFSDRYPESVDNFRGPFVLDISTPPPDDSVLAETGGTIPGPDKAITPVVAGAATTSGPPSHVPCWFKAALWGV